MKNQKQINKEGLTFEEWRAAAGDSENKTAAEEEKAAWLAGEDPCEWRAAKCALKSASAGA